MTFVRKRCKRKFASNMQPHDVSIACANFRVKMKLQHQNHIMVLNEQSFDFMTVVRVVVVVFSSTRDW